MTPHWGTYVPPEQRYVHEVPTDEA